MVRRWRARVLRRREGAHACGSCRLVEASVEGAFTSGTAVARSGQRAPAARLCFEKNGGKRVLMSCLRCSLNMLTQPNIRDTFLNG